MPLSCVQVLAATLATVAIGARKRRRSAEAGVRRLQDQAVRRSAGVEPMENDVVLGGADRHREGRTDGRDGATVDGEALGAGLRDRAADGDGRAAARPPVGEPAFEVGVADQVVAVGDLNDDVVHEDIGKLTGVPFADWLTTILANLTPPGVVPAAEQSPAGVVATVLVSNVA